MASLPNNTNKCCSPCSSPTSPGPVVPAILNVDTGEYNPIVMHGEDGEQYPEYLAGVPLNTSACGVPQGIVGPQGPAGATGADGATGQNAFSATTAQFVMPAHSATVAVSVPSAWMTVGQVVFVQFAGYMQVAATPDATHATLENLSDGTTYPDNAAPGTAITLGATVSAAGIQGLDGNLTRVAGGQLKGSYPNPSIGITTTKGDLIVDSGVSGGTATRLAVGANGTRLAADSTQALGAKWAKVDLSSSSEITGVMGISNGGTGGSSASAAKTALGIVTPTYYQGDSSDISTITSNFTADAQFDFVNSLAGVPRSYSLRIVCISNDAGTGINSGAEFDANALLYNWTDGSHPVTYVYMPIRISVSIGVVSCRIFCASYAAGSTIFTGLLMGPSSIAAPTSWANFKFRLYATY